MERLREPIKIIHCCDNGCNDCHNRTYNFNPMWLHWYHTHRMEDTHVLVTYDNRDYYNLKLRSKKGYNK